MREDLQQFENRSDDWLAKQRKYEENVSAWDLDEGRKIKEEHARIHAAYNKDQEYLKMYQQRTKEKSRSQEMEAKSFINSMEVIITIAIIVMIILLNL